MIERLTTATFDLTVFNKKMEEWAVVAGASARIALKTQGRLLIKQFIILTPPTMTKSEKAAEKASGENRTAKDRLERKINVDLRKCFAVASDSFISAIARRAGTSNVDAWFTTANKTDLHILWAKIDDAGMKAYHYSQRNSRGSVGGKSRVTLKWVGNKTREWRAPVAVTSEAYRIYLLATIAKIGRMKSGWLPAYDALEGGEFTFRIPTWVSKHGGKRVGDGFLSPPTEQNPHLYILNRARGISMIRHLVRSALRARGEAMVKDMRHYLDGTKRRLNN
jgi:hypothetical protein